MSERYDDVTPEERVRRARRERDQAALERHAVDSVVDKLRRHLEDNNFAERLYAQLIASRRHT